ncbi:uncharacterized protein CTRU02_207039 [Colletotrichum truncatum]|uniref:Uncharacterized protein n=1 Tax=Colletotrichum truncatum TaxID=5467 RepID=A0ACC3YZB6_COLTU|nr:uncharacterized protein CTRU02_11102 [Colletotrichum truncatum]KAF6786231.1 hypothetical protein CTRU02_11102 [Colletotrichum truncatum]
MAGGGDSVVLALPHQVAGGFQGEARAQERSGDWGDARLAVFFRETTAKVGHFSTFMGNTCPETDIDLLMIGASADSLANQPARMGSGLTTALSSVPGLPVGPGLILVCPVRTAIFEVAQTTCSMNNYTTLKESIQNAPLRMFLDIHSTFDQHALLGAEEAISRGVAQSAILDENGSDEQKWPIEAINASAEPQGICVHEKKPPSA